MEEEAIDLGFGGRKLPQKMGSQRDGMVLLRTRVEIGPGVKCPSGYYEEGRREKREGGQGMPDQEAQTIFCSY